MKPFIAILMGSDSDLPIMQASIDVLKKFGVGYEVKITSAHRTPQATHAYIHEAEQRGCAVFIAAAGMAAHLAGTVAALTIKPVIGVPIDASLQGMDALLSTVQMPGGIPVACMAIGKAGAKNAAFYAIEMLALSDPHLSEQLRAERVAQCNAVLAKDAALQAELRNK